MANRQPKVVQEQLTGSLASGLFTNTDKLKLFQNDITPNFDTILGDLTEATFTGYAAFTLADGWFVGTGANGLSQVVYNGLGTFAQTGVAVTHVVYGWYITDGAGANLLAVSRLPVPVTFDADGINLLLKAILEIDEWSAEHEEVLT